MSFNLLPLDQEDMLNGLPSFNNTLLLIETIKNLPSHSVTFEDKREEHDKKDDEDSLGLQIGQIEKVGSQGYQTPNTKRKKTGCTCTKTNCLKRYCECFSSGKLCSQECGCCGCFNTSENEQLIRQAKQQIKCKSSRKISQGCICKKSQCQKKYCQCFNAGVACTGSCRCKDCQNHFPPGGESGDNGHKKCRQKKAVEREVEVEAEKGKSEQSLAYLDAISGLDL